MDAKQLQDQLRKFNILGYTDQSIKYDNNNKGGKILVRTDGDWKYEDEFYGGEPYSGNETLWYKDIDVFRCVYWGKVEKGIDFNNIYNFLRLALKQGPTGKCVHRGPEVFVENNLKYTNECTGNIEEFNQVERIHLNNSQVYVAHFIGGRINTQKE